MAWDCKGKIAYGPKIDALAALNRLQKEYRSEGYIYLCSSCWKFHLSFHGGSMNHDFRHQKSKWEKKLKYVANSL